MIPLPFTLLFWVQICTPFMCFLSREDPLAFVEELVWWWWILSICLSVKLSISPSYLNEILAGWVFLFHYSKYVLPLPSGLKSFYWKISCYPYGNPLVCYLLLLPCCFNICSLCLIFVSLINMCLGVFCLGFILFGTLWVFFGFGWLFPSPF